MEFYSWLKITNHPLEIYMLEFRRKVLKHRLAIQVLRTIFHSSKIRNIKEYSDNIQEVHPVHSFRSGELGS